MQSGSRFVENVRYGDKIRDRLAMRKRRRRPLVRYPAALRPLSRGTVGAQARPVL